MLYVSCTHSYLTAHIWVCPPSEGDDYLFYCHPVDHVILDSKELIEWLREMLDSGKANGVVYDYQVGLVEVISRMLYPNINIKNIYL